MTNGVLKIETKMEMGDFEKGKKRLEKGLSQLSTSIKDLKKVAFTIGNEAGKGILKIGGAIKGMLKSIMKFVSVAQIMKTITEGLRNMAQASGSANEVISSISTSFLYLKNSIASAVMPILQALSPMITAITDKLTLLINMVGMITARIFGGATTFIKAKKAQVDYAASLDKTGKVAAKTAGVLASFDQIDILPQNDNDIIPGMPDPNDMFEKVEIPIETLDFADKISEALSFLKENLDDILRLVIIIGSGMLAWSISGTLGATLAIIAGNFLSFAGIVGILVSAFDMLANGVDWGNLTTMLLSVMVLVGGLALLFGGVAAAIGLLVSGIVILAIGLYDWIKTGELSTETFWLLEAGIIAVGVALALLIGWPALIMAALVGVALAIYKHWDEIKAIVSETWEYIKEIWGKLSDWFFSSVLEPIKSGFKDAINYLLELAETFANGFIKRINAIIEVLNGLSFNMPDWVPIIGGKSLGFNIPSRNKISLPRLATGAVIPPNSEFIAILGDQKSGTNIEAPLSTIEQALRNVLAESGSQKDGNIVAKFFVDGRELARATAPYYAEENNRCGIKLINGVI